MPNPSDADTIRILVSTDNHVGYNEQDATRGDDSWRTFHEIMELARARDVDMILLAGDLFHDNKPSRKSLYQVMRSLRMNCYGDKPCELQMLSDESEAFGGAFNHVNYQDPDINVAIPVFSIHGNHDDPSGAGGLAALDLLQVSGLLNYYGRVHESDNIQVKPVLLQKGSTKLALYGLSNVRDERLFRTFRDGNVKFFQPNKQRDDWFNLMSVHQNHHAYTDTGYLPENFLPTFLDLVIWGHEHECLIEPKTNPETNFRVSQPGSSVATSLVPGEAEAKHVGLLTITGKDFDLEPIRLKTVRPFKYKEIVLADDKYMRKVAQDHENITKVHGYLVEVVESMIAEAQEEWAELQQESGEDPDEDVEPPLPLIRLRVEYSAPEGGGKFDVDNPQRFSSRFVGRVANVTDVVQYYRKKRSATSRKKKDGAELPDGETMARLDFESVKVDKLVEEFLSAQSLTLLPQMNFSDAVVQFVDKDDKTAMIDFVDSSLKHLVTQVIEDRDEDADQDIDDEVMWEVMEQAKTKLEEKFQRGEVTTKRKGSRKPRPEQWDSDQDGPWEENIASIVRSDDEGANDEDDDDDDAESVASRPTTGRGRGRGRGGTATAGTTRKTAAATKKAPAKSTARGKKKQQVSEDEDEDSDVVMLQDDSDDGMFVRPSSKEAPAPKTKTATKPNGTSSSKATSSTRATKATAGTQSQLSFDRQTNGSGAAARTNGTASRAAAPKRMQEPSEDEISDDDDAFEPPPPSARAGARKR